MIYLYFFTNVISMFQDHLNLTIGFNISPLFLFIFFGTDSQIHIILKKTPKYLRRSIVDRQRLGVRHKSYSKKNEKHIEFSDRV